MGPSISMSQGGVLTQKVHQVLGSPEPAGEDTPTSPGSLVTNLTVQMSDP